MTRLEKLLTLVVVWALSIAGAMWYAYDWGWETRQAELNEETIKRQAEIDKKRDEGFELAAQAESKLNELEKKYAKLLQQRRAADKLKVQCPASGEIGDVVVPAGFLDSMFNRPAPAQAEPAASEPHATVR